MVPLNVRSAYSLLQSPMLPSQYVTQANQFGYAAIGLADEQNLYAMVNFYQYANKNELKPLLGLTLEVYGLINTSMTFPLHVYVQNQTGYQNLLAIASQQRTQTNALDLAKLAQEQKLEGLFLVIPPTSELSLNLMNAPVYGKQVMAQFQTYVHSSRLYLGIDLQMDAELLALEKQLSQEMDVPLLAFDEIRYAQPQDHFAYKILTYLKVGETISNIGAIQQEAGEQALRPMDDWYQAYIDVELKEAADQTELLAQQVDFIIPQRKVDLPHFYESSSATRQKLWELTQSQLAQLQVANQQQKIYQERLAYELKVINDLDFNDYFLIVWDVINFAKQNEIMTGPGRGSVAGSLVAYCLGITEVDPIANELLFERFLNPKRSQMPDIDIDIPDNKREMVLDYLHTKYGHDQVAQIITFSTMGMKQSLRDVARVFGLKPAEIDQLARSLPKDATSLQEAYQKSQSFQNAIIDLPVDGQLLLKTALQLTGIPRNSSLHAAGVVISSAPLINSIPVQIGEDGRLVTQLTKNPVEQLGLLKIDFLALSNLNILAIALHEVHKVKPNFDLQAIDLNDAETLALFGLGQTNGIFQFESNGMKQMLRQMQPDRFDDLVAANALYRPGPMANIPHFIARKHHEEANPTIDLTIDQLLAPTYGVIVYQEQVMRVAEDFAGFSLAEADLLRRAISKKDIAQMETVKQQFMQGAQAKGQSAAASKEVYQYIERFGAYGFNKSHAVAYSKLAFELAYLKVHYPLAFYKAVLNLEINNQAKVRIYINEAKMRDVKVLGPQINQSFAGYTVVNDHLQMGLASIKGLRKDFRDHLINLRQEAGPFNNLGDFLLRIDQTFRQMKFLEPLIMAGGLDALQPNRKMLSYILPGYLDAVQLAGNSLDLLNRLKPKQVAMEDYSKLEKLNQEFEVLGIYLSGHPLEKILQEVTIDTYTNISELSANQNGIKLILMIDKIKIIRTKKGTQMAFVDAADLTGKISLTIFPKQYQKYQNALIEGGLIAVYGNIEYQRNQVDLQLLVDQLIPANDLLHSKEPVVNVAVNYGVWYIRPHLWPIPDERLTNIAQIAQEFPGMNLVILVNPKNKNQALRLSSGYNLASGLPVKQRLVRIFGEQNISFKPAKDVDKQ
ncbi:DNA polymerase III subunit alpha [Weissella coleopterorum]|uniref:DNA polymerase III subunit alpha n=1 Tax=Weissella coleopterorum TaxID=2714949 RepID=A0A6G8B127_9LACO|nr:DNA polymerase III subunit alpha [Weissella coleopterorum]QIL50833.1 DNA polymerase III subunit alpha [Weissella coleopterorum]